MLGIAINFISYASIARGKSDFFLRADTVFYCQYGKNLKILMVANSLVTCNFVLFPE